MNHKEEEPCSRTIKDWGELGKTQNDSGVIHGHQKRTPSKQRKKENHKSDLRQITVQIILIYAVTHSARKPHVQFAVFSVIFTLREMD